MKVSILVAARNEEANIKYLLDSLMALSFDANEMEILIGNDASTDRTKEIAEAFAQKHSHIKIVDIAEGKLPGKTGVLAQLAQQAKGEFWLITDADMVLPRDWVQQFLAAFTEKVGVVTGVTTIENEDHTWFGHSQAIEWLLSIYLIYKLSRKNIPVTGMGNNMAISAEAYHKIGGYEAIGFSIVEDYALFQAIVAAGYDFVQLFTPEVLGFTKAQPTFKAFFKQRKRWLLGGLQSKSVLFLPAFLQALALPLALIFLLISPYISLGINALSIVSFSFLAIPALIKTHQKHRLKWLPVGYLYSLIFMFLQIINICLPGGIDWKNRQY